MTLHCFAAGQDSEKQLFRGDVASFCPLGLLASTSVRVKQSYNGSVCVCERGRKEAPAGVRTTSVSATANIRWGFDPE